MRGIILATAACPDGEAHGPLALRWLVDRPFVQHVVEQLVAAGVREIEVLVGDAPERFAALLGDGQRWGCALRLRLVRTPERPAIALRRAAAGARQVVLTLGHRLAAVTLDAPGALLFLSSRQRGTEWAGIATLPASLLRELPDQLPAGELGHWLLQHAERQAALRAAEPCLRADTAGDWLAAQLSALDGLLPGLQRGGRELRPGVFVAHGARVSPRARLVAPVHVGEHARIAAFAVVGPGSVIGARSVIDTGSIAVHALVLPDTYVGAGLELDRALAGGSTLTSVSTGSTVSVPDAFLLGPTGALPGPAVARRLAASALAALLLLGLGPIALLSAWLWRTRRGARWRRHTFVRPGTAGRAPEPLRLLALDDGRSASLRDLLTRVVPNLPAVVTGRFALVGPEALTQDEVDRLPPEWRALWERQRPGLVSAALAFCETGASEEERRLADAVHAVSPGARADLAVLGAYLSRLWHALAPQPQRVTAVTHPAA